MEIVCLDLEGVLVPEIWIAFAEETGIPELKRTTRDEPDYDKLMKYRLNILKEHGLGLKEIQKTIAKIDPIPGAKEFLDKLRAQTQVIILSDTFSQFAGPLMKKLGYPTIFCNTLVVGENGEISEETTENVMSQLRAHFKPEFLNRIDDTILFKPLALEDIKNIIVKMTSQLSHRLEEMDVQLELSEEVKVWIAENAYEPAYGARPLKRYLTKVIENPLAKLIIGGKIPPKSKVIVTLVDNKIDFDIQTIAE